VEEEETTGGGIVIPAAAKGKPQEGEVIAGAKARSVRRADCLPQRSEKGIVFFSKSTQVQRPKWKAKSS
jgi:co-chaperonin GroES (HSP10)